MTVVASVTAWLCCDIFPFLPPGSRHGIFGDVNAGCTCKSEVLFRGGRELWFTLLFHQRAKCLLDHADDTVLRSFLFIITGMFVFNADRTQSFCRTDVRSFVLVK